MKWLLLLMMTTLEYSGNCQTTGFFIDDRDGKRYETVTYHISDINTNKTITWMAENLNFKTKNSYCYDDYESNCKIMGRLYNWKAAKKACPVGWHLPNDNEWQLLITLFGGPSFAGKYLKSKSEFWSNKSQGTNKSLFNVMPYGNTVVGSGYYAFGIDATFWSSKEIDSTYARDWVISHWDKVVDYKGHKLFAGNSIRCVKD